MQSATKVNLEEVAARFRAARSRVKLSRIDFCAKHGLNPNTVHGWEMGRSVPSARLIKQFIDALAQEGIFCSEAWLLYEQGQAPVKINLQRSSEGIQPSPNDSDKATIKIESQCFIDTQTKAGHTPLVLEMSDNLMAPFFEQGDVIGGIVVKQPELLATKICIVETSPGAYIVRRLLCNADKFILLCADVTKPVIVLDNLSSVATIIWHRKQLVF